MLPARTSAATPVATGITGVTFTDNGLANGTTFFYKVKAVNAAGMSGFSNQASATPVAPTHVRANAYGSNAWQTPASTPRLF